MLDEPRDLSGDGDGDQAGGLGDPVPSDSDALDLGLYERLKSWVAFTEEDGGRLAALLPRMRPHFATIADHFYERILAHPDAIAVFTEGPAQVERLKQTMIAWLESGLAGPHGEAYLRARARIGRVHVLIGLPQHYMFTAMNVMRVDLHRCLLCEAESAGAFSETRADMDAVDRLLDLELAIMLHTYREDSERRMRAKERLATIGQIAASIGHDLRNPLGVIESSLFIMRRRTGGDEALERHLTRISEQVGVCNRIVTDLLEMARERPPRKKPESLCELAHRALESLSVPPGLTVDLRVPEGLRVPVDAGLVVQAIMNLVNNGVQAVHSTGRASGTVTIDAWPSPLADGQTPTHIELEVRDTGPGFELRTLGRVFEPLFSTRSQGTGLGLSLVRSIIERHGGEVRASNAPEGGAVVTLRLPVA